MNGDDIVLDFLRRILEIYPQTPRETVEKLEDSIRTDWGGGEVYVRKAGVTLKSRRIEAFRALGFRTLDAFEAAEVNPKTGYRIRKHRR